MKMHHSYYDFPSKTLYGVHNAGFYSCINQVRNTIYSMLNEKVTPEYICFSKTLYQYHNGEDLYPVLYKPNKEKILNLKNNTFNIVNWDPTFIDFTELDFDQLKLIEEAYFQPSDVVSNRIFELEQKYNIDYNNTVAVRHRGTDKIREATLQSIEWWMDHTDKILNHKDYILFQSDEHNFKNKFIEKYSDRVFILEKEINIYPEYNKIQWCVDYESIMRIISKCYKIFTHAGNGGIIPILYRGNIKNVYQCNHEGNFINYNEKINNI